MRISRRIENLPPYLYAEISQKIAEKKAKGEDIIDFLIAGAFAGGDFAFGVDAGVLLAFVPLDAASVRAVPFPYRTPFR